MCRHFSELDILIQLNEREREFLEYVCTEFTYKEIADKICVSVRTVDSYRDGLFKKLSLKTRVGLVMYANRHGIVSFS
ncbi:response regulator transcription factor [Ferruginibacter sp.]|uniref:response regulator transcription factor n=1 Tax=Ferruginibacter sp. TaxID=1940288 RepID=UPI00349E7102